MVEWFKAAVLKTAEAKASGSSNLPLSAIFVSENGERSRKASLHCAKHNFSQKPQAFLHIFTFHGSLACEVAPCGRL